MTANFLPTLGHDAACWIWGFPRDLDAVEQARILAAFELFLPDWKAHKKPVTGEAAILENRFVILGGTVEGGFSGCSMDAAFRVLKGIRQEHGLDGLDRSLVYWRDERGIQVTDRYQFGEKVRQGELGAETPVFDLTLTRLEDVRKGLFERPMRETWHARAFLNAA